MKALINKKELLRYEHLIELSSFLAIFYISYEVKSYKFAVFAGLKQLIHDNFI